VLKSRGFDTAIVGGLTTPICVETTVDGLSMAGIQVAVLSDATASQPIGAYSAELAHEFSIARMGYLMGQVITTEELIKSMSDTLAN
jgi:nicotinamidase-related amidase